MFDYNYILTPYSGKKSRHTCPSCQSHNTFSLYVSTKTGQPLAKQVGRCNKENKCGYHYKPKDFFKDHPSPSELYSMNNHPNLPYVRYTAPQQPSYIDQALFQRSVDMEAKNHFLDYLKELFGKILTLRLARRYLIGTSSQWEGATIFWQRDAFDKIRTGKIILYNSQTGQRIKQPYNHITWVHSILKQKDFHLQQCLFGEHLLKDSPKQPVAIVESEKTAIIASVYMSNYTWLATGGISNFTPASMRVLVDRDILVFPDLKCYGLWNEKAKQIKQKVRCKIVVSDLIEKKANELEKKQGLDIADYLVRKDPNCGWALTDHGYPIFWDYQNMI